MLCRIRLARDCRQGVDLLCLAIALVFGCGVSSLNASQPIEGTMPPDPPHWIWVEERNADYVQLSNTFVLPANVRKAAIQLMADFCTVTVSINGKRHFSVDPYHDKIDLDISNQLLVGSNSVELSVAKVPGPTAIALRLSVAVENESKWTRFDLDDRWKASILGGQGKRELVKQSDAPIQSLGPVKAAIWGEGRRSAQVMPTENYEQWQQAKEGKEFATQFFWTAPGFEIRLVKSALPSEGSWVSMAFDPQGRLTIAREDVGLLRLTFNDSVDIVQHVESINQDLKECRGLLYAHNALYANANESKGFYRLRDTNDDGSLDDVQLLREFPGKTGHGRNDVALGRDGEIYLIHGDSVDLPTSEIIDRTSPLRDQRRSEVRGQGHVLRTDSEGKNWELVCTGLRNPFGIAVDTHGDLFTYDADAEFDMGTPWYRPTRIVQLYSGADFGWRAVTGKWPPYFADHAENSVPLFNIGKGSPTAVQFGTGTRFPKEYQRSLFVLDWTFGRILAVHLVPRGSGYRASVETLLQGRPLNVTDLAVGPDGSLYVVTGGRKTQSALYRISYNGPSVNRDNTGIQEETVIQEETGIHEQECEAFGQSVRPITTMLSSLHKTQNAKLISMAWQHMDSRDPWIKNMARIAVEHHSLADWKDLASSETRPRAVAETILALIRTGDRESVPWIFDKLLSLDLKLLEMEDVWSMLHCYEILNLTERDELSRWKSPVAEQLESILKLPMMKIKSFGRFGTDANVRGALLNLLAKLESDVVVDEAVKTLLNSSVQEERLDGLLILRNIQRGWSDAAREKYLEVLSQREQLVSGEGMPQFFAQIRSDVESHLSPSQRENLSEWLTAKKQSGESMQPAKVRPTVRKWETNALHSMIASVTGDPDVARGQLIFREAMCANCHRAGAIGPAVGPDLTHLANRFSRLDILRAIIEPSSVIAESYRNIQVVTSDGRAITGRLVVSGDYRLQKIKIATNPMDPHAMVEIEKSDIEMVKDSEVSPMPAGLLDGFTLDEIKDLLAYLGAGVGAGVGD